MERDRRYLTIKRLIEAGHITVFKEIFEYISISRVALDLGLNHVRLKKLIENAGGWMFKDAYDLAKLIDVNDRVIIDLIYNQYVQSTKKKKK